MTAVQLYTDPTTGQQYRWDGQQWLLIGYPNPNPIPAILEAATYPTKTVSKTRKDTSHLFHLVMTILTCGVWGLFVWLPITIWHKTGPRKKTVTKPR